VACIKALTVGSVVPRTSTVQTTIFDVRHHIGKTKVTPTPSPGTVGLSMISCALAVPTPLADLNLAPKRPSSGPGAGHLHANYWNLKLAAGISK
jgi:hypothetical protein